MTRHQPPTDEMGARHQAREPDLIDWINASHRRDSGMTRAVEHADRKEPEWSTAAFDALVKFAKSLEGNGDGTFMAEDAREFIHGAVGLPPPPDGRAWGAVLQRAARAGHIVAIGWGQAKSSNCGAKRLWARA